MTTRRPRLLGKYKTPLFNYGDSVICEVRGEVTITSLKDSPIPWPIAKRPCCRARAMVVFGDLAKAVRREAASAVAFHWGVTAQTVTRWREALGVGPMTEGTTRLKSTIAKRSPGVARGLEQARAKARDPERRKKISLSRLGKPRQKYVIEAMRKGRTGKPHSDETKKKMSEAHKRRGTVPPAAGQPWTAREEALLGKVPDELVARKTGCEVSAVVARRRLRRIERYSAWD